MSWLNKFGDWFEDNQTVCYQHAVKIGFIIWSALLVLFVLLFCIVLLKQELVALSAMGITLSAMIASLMMWYNIETNTKSAERKEHQEMIKEFLSFYEFTVITFRYAQMIEESGFHPTTDSRMMLEAGVCKYLNRYLNYSFIYLILKEDELHHLRESILSIEFDIINVKRNVNTQKSIKDIHNAMLRIITQALNRPYVELVGPVPAIKKGSNTPK